MALTAFAVIFSTSFMACNKDDDDNKGNDGISGEPSIVEAKSIDGDCSGVATVKVVVELLLEDVVIATGEFKNGGFKIQLPETIPGSDLMPVDDWFDIDLVSDESAKISWCEPDHVYGYDKDGDFVGDFAFINGVYIDEGVYILRIYADRDFTVKGNDYYSYYDCTFKKGWNIVYFDEEEGTATTTKPSGKTLRWKFFRYE